MNVLSLFSGAGGLDCGLRNAGLDVVVSQEWDRSAIKTLQANGFDAVVGGDLEKLIAEDPSCSFLPTPPNLDVVVGGPPCQSFSHTGNNLGMKDKRGRVLGSYVRVVAAKRPRFFVMENVSALAGKKHAVALNGILRSLRALGYKVAYRVLNAADFGVPQVRRRIIIIGSRDGSPIVFPSPTHDRNSYRTFGDAVEGLKGAAEGVKFSDRVLGLIGMIPEGENWHSLPPFLQTAVVGKYKNPSGSILRRCSFSKPLPTLLASGPRQWRTLLAHPVEDRPLNVAEYSRGQGFPDDWKFVGSKGNKYKQIGNAVPIALGEAIGRALIAMNQPTFK